ncbi:unnamed protein product [Linum tenue]|uniref:Uncharacterized protein n=1 Tax=Linum tenue TaxID=586396 RepID=A0AAV0KHR7_9ROSI|nr:unnamed protein product [Linum tenue]CAI0626782.1 unnamed protein product [Linum tenue]
MISLSGFHRPRGSCCRRRQVTLNRTLLWLRMGAGNSRL